MLNIVRREVELLCSPLNIPGELTFNLEGLEIGDALHISAIDLPEGVATTTDRDFTVATIAAPTVMPSDSEMADGEADEEGEEGVEGDGAKECRQAGDDGRGINLRPPTVRPTGYIDRRSAMHLLADLEIPERNMLATGTMSGSWWWMKSTATSIFRPFV